MRINRFFSPRDNITVGSSVKLEDSDNNHVKKVLRLKKGDAIIIFNGAKEYLAELDLVQKDTVKATVTKLLRKEDFSKEGKVEVTLIQGLLKAGKFDFIVEKATEIGVDNIVPLEAEYSQMKIDVAEKKINRWTKIAITAAKQSERIRIPEITTPARFEDLAKIKDDFDMVLFCTIPREKIKASLFLQDLKELSLKTDELKHVALLIGPEGGFSPGEHEMAKDMGFKFITLGENVFRAETASIYGLSVLNFLLN
jgi:16S rRNA (uracil1498-N3)-methyltransferase